MTIRSDLAINWGVSPRIITVATPSVELKAQDLYDTLRDLAAHYDAMDDDEIVDAGGKEYLDASRNVVLTVTLRNARVKFEDRATWTTCTISGNLVALNSSGTPISPIEPAAYVTIDRAVDSSGTVSNIDDVRTDLAFIKKIEQGRWKIHNNQMIFYDTNGYTPIRTFNLKNSSGNPTMSDVFERIPV